MYSTVDKGDKMKTAINIVAHFLTLMGGAWLIRVADGMQYENMPTIMLFIPAVLILSGYFLTRYCTYDEV